MFSVCNISFLERFLVELITVKRVITKFVGDLLDLVLIEHSQTSAQYESLSREVRLKLVVGVDESFLGEELRLSFDCHEKLVHYLAYLGVLNTVCGTCVLSKCCARVNQEEPRGAKVPTTALILDVDLFTTHIGAFHIINLLHELDRMIITLEDFRTGHWKEVIQRLVFISLNPNALNVAINVCLKSSIKRV